MLAMEFFNPWLLLGLLAAAIPFVLHLLSSVRAQEAKFPTLRFLRISMEKTARRRQIQHWALLSVRAALLAILCLAVAEPISKATGGWLGRSGYTAAILLDNSYSMATRDEGGSRFDRAKAQAANLLGGEDMPAQASLLTTAGGFVSPQLTNRLDTLRDALSKSVVGYGQPVLAQRFTQAVDSLDRQSSPRKAIYIFSDLQRSSFEELLATDDLARAKDVYVFIVNTGGAPDKLVNVGIDDLEIAGRRVVDSSLEFTVRLVNSSPSARAADVAMRLDGGEPLQRTRVNLAPQGKDG
ncbi:MAG: VWA domain-containing protein, partial [Planctomycetaceae bacterium]